MISSTSVQSNRLRRRANTIFAVLVVFVVSCLSQDAPPSDSQLLAGLTADFDRLASQTIRPAEGYIPHLYLIPAGYYSQMWDWEMGSA